MKRRGLAMRYSTMPAGVMRSPTPEMTGQRYGAALDVDMKPAQPYGALGKCLFSCQPRKYEVIS